MQGYLEKGIQNSHGARPVHQIISMIKWIRTSRLSIKNSPSSATRVACYKSPLGRAHMLPTIGE